NFTWKSYSEIAKHPDIAWIVPISLGDSHRGFRVLGTTSDYYRHYRFRGGNTLEVASGELGTDLFDAVIGWDVAARLGYQVGDRIVIGHGLGSVSFVEHDDKPFRVAGILAKTGTPLDRTVPYSHVITDVHLIHGHT